MSDEIKTVAIIAPHRGRSWREVEQHIAAAKALGAAVAKLGAFPWIPHANTEHMLGLGIPEAFWLKGTRKMAGQCDTGILGAGWEWSEGSCRERGELLSQGKPVFDELEDLERWIREEGD